LLRLRRDERQRRHQGDEGGTEEEEEDVSLRTKILSHGVLGIRTYVGSGTLQAPCQIPKFQSEHGVA
jgi:hypothetical protein